MKTITIIDYGSSNILSVQRAFEYCGANVIITKEPEEILKAEALVLPGVGAFADGMKKLEEHNLIEPILQYSKKNKPFLGICLGMQMMMEESLEFGKTKGLGLISGKVIPIEKTNVEGENHKIPHVGWSSLEKAPNMEVNWEKDTMLSEVEEKEEVYFVHSYKVVPDDNNVRLADTYYGGRLISAVIKKEKLYGCQFHPEKSGRVGLKIIESFVKY